MAFNKGIKKIKTVLTFGHLPKYAGGKQSSGLAAVIWELSNNINQIDSINFKYVIAATDINKKENKISSTEVLGWLKNELLMYVIFRPWILLFYVYKSIKLNYKYKLPLINSLVKLIYYHKTISKVKPSLIHLHGCTSIVFFEIINIKKYKIILTIHGLNGQNKSISDYKNYQLMEKAISLLPIKIIVFITKEISNHWITVYGKPNAVVKVILNAYNRNLFYYVKNEKERKKINLATIGSISLLKGQNRVLEALKDIDNSKIHYICIGNGLQDEIVLLENYAKKYHISFEITGYLPPEKIREKLSAIDYMILPSSSEGFGLVFLESIACGVPIILPENLPIVKEHNLLSNKNSIFMKDESPKSIAKTLSNLDLHSFSKVEVANSILNNSWDKIAKEYVQIINKII